MTDDKHELHFHSRSCLKLQFWTFNETAQNGLDSRLASKFLVVE